MTKKTSHAKITNRSSEAAAKTTEVGTRRAAQITAAKVTIELLAERWPQCFSVYEKRRRPLKLGIHHDILAARESQRRYEGANAKKIAKRRRDRYAADPDHIIPLVRGGHHIPDNTRIICSLCNTRKSTHSLEDWLMILSSEKIS